MKMKSYEEMALSVMGKAEAQRKARRHRNNTLLLTVACSCCILLSLYLINSNNTLAAEPADSLALVDRPLTDSVIKPRTTLLCSASGNEILKVMEENIKIPYKAELRVRSIVGLTEEEKQILGKEEAVYISKLWGDHADESGFGRYMLDNVMVTTISVGEFALKLNEIDKIARIRIAVSENGMLISYPRVDTGKTSAYTFEDGQQLQIDINGSNLKSCLEENSRDTLGLFWNISPWAVTKLDKDPNMDLSQFSDKITIWIDYTDGREEITTVSMQIDGDGKIYAVLEGTVINI